MKKIILTIDYELHFGKKTGNVKDCMIEPTKRLISICDEFGCKMTVFWDILHFYKLLELKEQYPELLADSIEIEAQIKELVYKGHDIQLHIHPHWIDAKYSNSKWEFVYDRFSLSKLSISDDHLDINSIIGCIKISKTLMEDIVKKYDSTYKVKVFRAGGYLIEPFSKLAETFIQNGILIDSSVCPNLFNKNGEFSYDFRNYPDLIEYKFNLTPSKIDHLGTFLELPVRTIYISGFRNLYFFFLRKIKYKNLESGRKGYGAGSTRRKSFIFTIYQKLLKVLKPSYNQLTSDSCFSEKYRYLLRKSPDYSVQILHPKLLNDHMLSVMKECLVKKKSHFISIQDYLQIHLK